MKISAKIVMNELARKTNLIKEISEQEREQLQKTLLGMLSDIIKVCDMKQLRVALVGGSALGAIRHGGFIPWDDDIDLGMPRKDWEIFKRIFDSALGNNYILEAPNYNGKDCKNPWGKIYLKNSILEELQDINMPYNRGIFIDVFIYENVSPNSLIRKIDAKLSDFLKGVATSITMYRYPNELEKRFYAATPATNNYYKMRKLLGFLFSWCSHKAFCDWLDSFLSRHKEEIGLYTSPYGRKNYLNEIVDSNIWPLKEVDFNGVKSYVFNNVVEYLILLYGKNYLEVPPVEKRERHFIVNLKFPEK